MILFDDEFSQTTDVIKPTCVVQKASFVHIYMLPVLQTLFCNGGKKEKESSVSKLVSKYKVKYILSIYRNSYKFSGNQGNEMLKSNNNYLPAS